MKLPQLIDYLNQLNAPQHDPDYDMAMKKFWNMAHMISHHAVQFNSLSIEFKDAIVGIQQAFDRVHRSVDTLKEHIVREIERLEPTYYEQSEILYKFSFNMDTNDQILNRELIIDDNSNNLLRSHLKNRNDWRLPGMLIRPGRTDLVNDLVAFDPLYLVDHNVELLQPAVQNCTPQYQRRLRTYGIDDYRHQQPLWQLPDNQFGLIMIWNYFNYKPLDIVYRYLADIFVKLRPGGVVIFTFNDCDLGHGAALVEQKFMCYTPSKELKSHAQELGFEILYQHNGQGNVAWLELKKPGEISSIKGGQTLARLVANQQ